jgi:hypothetical protein
MEKKVLCESLELLLRIKKLFNVSLNFIKYFYQNFQNNLKNSIDFN